MSYLKITSRRIMSNESDPHLVYKECFPRPELRYDENQPRDDHGRFTSGGGSGLTSDGRRGRIKTEAPKMSKSEVTRVSHQIATDHPNLKADGAIHCYENRNDFYTFSVREFGSYSFHSKIPIVGNEEKIKAIRTSLGEWG